MRSVDQLERSITDDLERDPLSSKTTTYLFAPVDKRAFGIALGLAAALIVGAVTILDVLASTPWIGLGLLREYFAGYTLSWTGALIGAAWAFAVGFCAGWLLAFTRNLILAASLFLLRSRSDMDEASDFLDHI